MCIQPTHEDLFAEYLEWRAFDDEPESEPFATRGLDRRASFEMWLRARGELITAA